MKEEASGEETEEKNESSAASDAEKAEDEATAADKTGTETGASEETTETTESKKETTAAETKVEETKATTAAAEITVAAETIAETGIASSSNIGKPMTVIAHFIDEEGNAIPDKEDAELTVKGSLDLTKAPKAVRGYSFVEARFNDQVITRISQAAVFGEDETYYEYTAADGSTDNFDEGSELNLVYAKKDIKSIYTYIGGGVKVTAKLEKADAIPDEAVLRVTELTKGSLYDAYIAAMDEADPEIVHTKDNTVIRDISFIAKNADGQETEYEPTEGSVKVSIEYLNNTLEQKLGVTDVSEVKTYHLPLADGVKAEGEKTIDVQDVVSSDINVEELSSTTDGEKTVEVEMDSFSVCAQTVNGTEYLVDDTALDLTSIVKENGGVTAAVQTTGEIDRNGQVVIALSFDIDDDRLADTVKTTDADTRKTVLHNVWEYDLKTFLETAPLQLVNGASGRLYDGGYETGAYSVSEDKITFTVDPTFLVNHTHDVKGSFTFQAKINTEMLDVKKEYTFTFPGSATSTTITVKDVNASSSKSCKNAEWKLINGQSKYVVLVSENKDGSYTLSYTVTFKADAGLTALTLKDQLSGGTQTYDQNSFKIKVSGSETKISGDAISFSDTDGSVTVDVLKALNIDKTTANQEYKISYTTTVLANALETEMINKATWTWDGNRKTENTNTVTPYKKETLKVTKSVVANNGEYTYTITVGDTGVNMKGHTITDTMSDNQVLVGNITISPAVNGSEVITPTWTDDGSYSTNDVSLFTYTFPTDQDCIGTYIITYKTKAASSDSLTGQQSIKNKVTDNHNGNEKSDSTEAKHDFGTKKEAKISKSWTKWDESGRAVVWSIAISLPDGISSLNNVVVKEEKAKYEPSGDSKKDMSIDLSQITVKGADGNALTKGIDYSIDATNNIITFPILSQNVTIEGVRSYSTYDYQNTDKSYVTFSNKATVTVEGQNENSNEKEKKYETSNWSMTKDAKYDEDKQTVTWTVKINEDKCTVSPNVPLIFKDTIPTGMELDGDLTVDSSGTYNGSLRISSSNKNEINVNITEETQKTNQYYYLQGISGNSLVITYKTKLTSEAMKDQNKWTAEYKNRASVLDATGTELKWAEKEIKIDYKVIKKQDTSDQNLDDDLITYKVVINPDAVELNEGNELTLTDTLPEGTNFVSNGYSFDPALEDAKVSLNSGTRTLTVKVPDKQKITFTYKVKSVDLHTNGKKFQNTVELKGKGTYTDSVIKKHYITKHAGTISGANDSIYIYKYDEDNLNTALKDAKFKLERVEITENGVATVESSNSQTGITDDNGKIEFTKLTPVNEGSSAPYYGYKLTETSAPANYEIDETYKNGYYFIFHTDADGKKAAEVEALVEKANSGVNYNVLPGATTISVSNKKTEDKGSLKFTKSFAGDTITDEDLEKISFTVKDSKGTVIGTYKLSEMKSGDKYEKTIEGLAPGKYTVTENNGTAEGYTLTKSYKVDGSEAEAAEGTVKKDQTLVIVITNTYTYVDHEVEISKTDINGSELAGASLKVTDVAGNVVDEWTSGTETHKVTVKPGTYVLHESGAPENYVVASDITFTVDKTGKVTVAGQDVDKVTMVDKYKDHSVVISKTNIGGKELNGAKLTVTDASGAVVQEWTSAAAEHKFMLQPGTYVLHETAAPNGYLVANDIHFTVAADGTVTVDGKVLDKVTMVDIRSGGNGGGGGGGNHPSVPTETTPAETVPETTAVETTPSAEGESRLSNDDVPETDEYGNVYGANRGKRPGEEDDGDVYGANRKKVNTGDEANMAFYGIGFFGFLAALLGWFGIRIKRRED